jgi:hypothetical protein
MNETFITNQKITHSNNKLELKPSGYKCKAITKFSQNKAHKKAKNDYWLYNTENSSTKHHIPAAHLDPQTRHRARKPTPKKKHRQKQKLNQAPN